MKAIHKKRLMDVVKALREAKTPRRYFTMTLFRHPCGTPACALGHYAMRKDLQKVFSFRDDLNSSALLYKGEWYEGITQAEEYFGVTWMELDDLFGSEGCNNAKSTTAAANYIERFVTRKEKEQRAQANR